MCVLKRAGSLGIRRSIHDWNCVALGRYVRAITVKKDNLWIKRINELYVIKK